MRKYISGLLILIPLLTIFIFSNTYCTIASDQEPASCSQIKKDDILPQLRNLVADIQILEMSTAPIEGLCEIAIETKGRKGIIYIDPSAQYFAQYLISGSLIEISTKTNLTQEKLISLNKIDVSQIPLDNALVMGDKDAKHRVIVFSDPD
jgi:thiol:disulfide interchange protein DsbC